MTCGDDGIHKRSVMCVRSLGEDEQIALEDSVCGGPAKARVFGGLQDQGTLSRHRPHLDVWQLDTGTVDPLSLSPSLYVSVSVCVCVSLFISVCLY